MQRSHCDSTASGLDHGWPSYRVEVADAQLAHGLVAPLEGHLCKANREEEGGGVAVWCGGVGVGVGVASRRVAVEEAREGAAWSGVEGGEGAAP
eukprot:3790075-Prymnesium_polylepis.1